MMVTRRITAHQAAPPPKQAANLKRMLSKAPLEMREEHKNSEVEQHMLRRQNSYGQKRKQSAMLTDFKYQGKMDDFNFANYYCTGGAFTLDEAEAAMRIASQGVAARNRWGAVNLTGFPVNTLRILLGLALVNELEDLFDATANSLGSNIESFSGEFKQARRGYNKMTRALFELTLKAAIACCDVNHAKTVLWFSKDHNYMVTIDEQTVMHALFSTYSDRRMDGDYSMLRMLVELEVTYRIIITEKNRAIIAA